MDAVQQKAFAAIPANALSLGAASVWLLERHPPFQERVENLDADPAFLGRLFLRETVVEISGDFMFENRLLISHATFLPSVGYARR